MKKVLTGNECLGIEFGSTRVKACLIDESGNNLAHGSYKWENSFENGWWTYSLESAISGMQACYNALNTEVEAKFGSKIQNLAALGVSAMMHGYLPFGENGELLVPYRTWRNTKTAEAANELSNLFRFNIPQRWSIAHLRQAELNGEAHVKDIKRLTTLAGQIHFLLSGENTLGIGEASGMFPVDARTGDYNAEMLEKFDALENRKWKLKKILPDILCAGQAAGALTVEGAALLDKSGFLLPGAVMAPPEGDAGTGMVATNSIEPKTGNVSAGTSIFSMVVLEKPFEAVREEIDIVSTPIGDDVAMIHCNNCCTEIDKWVEFIGASLELFGQGKSKDELYNEFYSAALKGEPNCGGVTAIGLHSGEPVAKLPDASPLIIRSKTARFTPENLSRSLIYSALSTLKIGHNILKENGVEIKFLNAHGGLVKSLAARQIMADALGVQIRTGGAAGEGGAWGMALLALFCNFSAKMNLETFLQSKIFAKNETVSAFPTVNGAKGFEEYHRRFLAATDTIRNSKNVF